MSIRIQRFWNELLKSLLSNVSLCCDRVCYLNALEQTLEGRAQGFLSLGRLYEMGSRIVSRDLALAYAMYCLSAQKQRLNDTTYLDMMRIQSKMTARDWVKANETMEKCLVSIKNTSID